MKNPPPPRPAPTPSLSRPITPIPQPPPSPRPVRNVLTELEALTARLRDGADAYVRQVRWVETTWRTAGAR